MRVPLILRIGALILGTTGFYTYVGQLVPQKEVQPPKATLLGGDLSPADMAKVGRSIMEGKGICLTCHTQQQNPDFDYDKALTHIVHWKQ